MIYYGDYHTHTFYSDGRSSITENIESAISKGLKEIAITDHSITSPSWGALSHKKLIKQTKEIGKARALYGDKIDILHGIEADIRGLNGSVGLTPEIFSKCDILLVGYHSFAKAVSVKDWRQLFVNAYLSFIFKPSKRVIARNTRALINAIRRYPIDIVAHINHLFKVDCYEVAKACVDYGTYIELNEKHLNLSDADFQNITKTGVGLIANSDAHHYSSIGEFKRIESFLKRHNYPIDKLVNYDKQPTFTRRNQRRI